MTNAEINDFLLKGRVASDACRKQGKIQMAEAILQITSIIALRHLEKPKKVFCRCGTQLTKGIEIEFYNHTGLCYTCDSAYSDTLYDNV